MKTLLKKVIALIIAVSMATVPFTVSAKTPSTVYEDTSMNYKYITYSDPLVITQGYTARLENNVYGGSWYVPAGGLLFFNVHFLVTGTYRYIIAKPNGDVVGDYSFYTDNCSVSLRIQDGGLYNLIIQPVTSVPALIDRFCVDID